MIVNDYRMSVVLKYGSCNHIVCSAPFVLYRIKWKCCFGSNCPSEKNYHLILVSSKKKKKNHMAACATNNPYLQTSLFVYKLLLFLLDVNQLCKFASYIASFMYITARWWWRWRHGQFWIPVQFSEKSNFNPKLH